MSSVLSIKICILFFLVIPAYLFCQTDSNFNKLSPELRKHWQKKSRQEISVYIVAVKDNIIFQRKIESNHAAIILNHFPASKTFVIKTSWQEMTDSILPDEQVYFVEENRRPKEELAVSNLDLSTNKVNVVHNLFPQYNGNGITVSIKENKPDTTDIDFKGRYATTSLSSAIESSHATIMMTIAGGAGNSFYEGKGVAWESRLSSSDFALLMPDADAAYQQYDISVQNHSYGVGIENFYGADAAAYDATLIAHPSLMHVFSVGNSGQQTSTTGPYANIPGFANLTGSFKMAKNILTVGHTDSFGTVLPASSRGPAYDGRVKPELVAFALDGSSGAAAIVSGIALTLQQAYKNIHGILPAASCTKSILINTADDVGAKGIDFISGYGAVNAYKAMQNVVNGNQFSGTSTNGSTTIFNLTIPANIKLVKVTLCWDDPKAAANAQKALLNDLDVELRLPATSQVWLPWVLSHYPNIDSLQKPAVRKKDTLNNVEQITLDNPAAGNYQIAVNGFKVTGSQQYSIAYQLDTADKFTWYYPIKSDNIFGGSSNILRWESTYTNATGQLQYSLNGNSWQTIDNAVDLTKGFYKWIAPDTFATTMLRMNFSSQNIMTDTVTISKRFDVFVGFNCADSFMFYWNKVLGISNYRVYSLGDKYMELMLTTTDTSVVLSKSANPSLHYAVAPMINNKIGVRSYAYNYTLQGVDCFVKSFTAFLSNNTAILDLLIGTNYKVKKIGFQKLTLNGIVDLQTVNNISGLQFNDTDAHLTKGLNIYRAKIQLNDGQTIYSDTAIVYYFTKDVYILYPNPVAQYQPVNILSDDPDITQLQVFNTVGQRIFEKNLDQLSNQIPAGLLSKGFYFLRIVKQGKTQITLKLVVY